MHGCERAAITGNIFEGFDAGEPGKTGAELKECKNVTVNGNVVHGFAEDFKQTDCENIIIASNITGGQ
jgi:hypothetical protein